MGQLVLRFECKAQTPWGIASKAELRPFCPFLFSFCLPMCPPCLPSISFYFYVVADQKKKARKKTRSQIKRKEVCCQLVAQLALQTKNCQNRPTAEAGYEDPVRNVPCTQSMCLRWLLKCSFQHKVIKCEDRRQCSTNQGFQIFFSQSSTAAQR